MIETFVAEIKVDTKIVGLLSNSTYQNSFASSIRELVSNSYDADALSVQINANLIKFQFSIEDDGNGMTRTEFENFIRIAGTKSGKSKTRKYNRNRIGQFGIGFLSVFPFCDELEVVTTTENSTDLLRAVIPTKKYLNYNQNKNIDEIQFEVSIIKNAEPTTTHFTRITLLNTTHVLKKYFEVSDSKRSSVVTSWNPYERFKWELQEILPLKYDPKSANDIIEIVYKEPIGMTISLNNDILYRNTYGGILLEKGSLAIGNIDCDYVLTTPFESIKPMEARGVQIRVNNVAIGKRTDFLISRDRGFSRLHWISGELHLSTNSKEALSISRDSFVSSSEIDEVFEYFYEILKKQAYYVEHVAVAEKKINSIVSGGESKFIDKNTELTSNLNTLTKAGFEVKTVDLIGEVNNSIIIDKKNKIVIVQAEEEVRDTPRIKILDNDYYVEYFVGYDSEKPCYIVKDTLFMNRSFKLFNNKNGDIFKKVFSVAYINLVVKSNNEILFNNLVTSLLKEFEIS